MAQHVYGETFSGTEAENYEKYFVPTIGEPLARDLIRRASLRSGERVLDVACGTGVVARLAAETLGAGARVAGLDVSPSMLEVARTAAPEGLDLDWYETSAEAMPLPDDAFDVVLCQMGLQFMPDRLAALKEMKRILAPGGRLVLSLPGPTPRLFAIMAEGLARHIHPDCAAFPDMVFSLSDADELRALIGKAGFESIDVQREIRTLQVPPPRAFLWQYVHCTPLANPVAAATEERRAAAEREIAEGWKELMVEGNLSIEVGMTTACAR